MAEPSASAGTKVFIGPTTPAANAAAYAALAWVEIGLVETVAEFGDTSATITWTGLSDARVRKMKGARDAGDLAVVCAKNDLDPGQIAAVAAEKTKFSYAIKVVYDDSADANDTDGVDYFHAKVMSAKKGIGSSNDVQKRTFALAIDTGITEVPTTVVP